MTNVEMIKKIISYEIPVNVKKQQGLDGHSYDFIIYNGKESFIYRSWCVLPKEWIIFIPIIELLIDMSGLNKEKYGVYKNKY